MQTKRALRASPRPLTLATLLDAGLASENPQIRKWFESLQRWLDRQERISRVQPREPLPGDSGIDNLPKPATRIMRQQENRPPESNGCTSALTRLFSRQGRKR